MRTNRWLFGAVAVALLSLALGCVTTGPLDPKEQTRKRALAFYNLGVDHLNRGRTPMAIRELRKAARLSAGDPWIHLALAEAYRRKVHHEDAIRHLERAIEIAPDFQAAHLNLSGVCIQAGRYEEAIRHAELLVDDPTFPAPWRALTNLGWAQYRVGRGVDARENLGLAIQYHENYWPALLNLGILENAEGRRLEAVSLFRRVLERKPGGLVDAEASYRIAEIYIALGQQERAVQYLARAAKAKPSGRWGRKSEEYLQLLR